MEYVLQTHNLCKKYNGRLVLKNVNMNIAKGDIYGFAGENGSGKTTVIRLISGLIRADSGEFELFGVKNTDSNISLARKKLGAIVETPSIYQNFSAYDNLKMQCEMLGIKNDDKIKEVLEDVGLQNLYKDRKKAGNFSLGMRQRLGIAMALLGEPDFLLLDEPMNGLDPAGIVSIRELIIRLNQEKGITFLISSHLLSELSLVATKYGIISRGTIIKEISAGELKNECRKTTFIYTRDLSLVFESLSKILPADDIKVEPLGVKVLGDISLTEVLKKILSDGATITDIKTSDTNIEEYYMSLLGGGKNA